MKTPCFLDVCVHPREHIVRRVHLAVRLQWIAFCCKGQCSVTLLYLKCESVSKSAAVRHYDTFAKRFSDVSSVCSGSHIDYSMPKHKPITKGSVCVHP